MIVQPQIKIYLLDESKTQYYIVSNLDANGNYVCILQPSEIPISYVPKGWDEVMIEWQRHPQFLGLFRSQTQTFSFVKDARAILLKLFYASGGGIQAKCVMRVDIFIDVNQGYETAYQSEINFYDANDGKYKNGNNNNPTKEGEFAVSTLDSKLFTDLQARGDTKFNIPIWNYIAGNWDYSDAVFMIHDGIKLLYNSTFSSSATEDNPLDYKTSGVGIVGFNNGNHGTGINDGRHTIPSMTPFNIVQDNGTTTFIGNDILQPFLLQRNQGPGSSDIINERSFSDTNSSKPYTTENYSLKHLLNNKSSDLHMYASVSGKFKGDINGGTTGPGSSIRFVLFEIDSQNNSSIGLYTYQSILEIELPNTGLGIYTPLNNGVFSNYLGGQSFSPTAVFNANPSPITLKYDKVYVFGIIWDNTAHLFQATDYKFMLSSLQFSLYSKYDSGVSGVPINAPFLPPSVFPGFKLSELFKKITENLPTRNTDGYGFPIPITPSPYKTISNALSDPTLKIGDMTPRNIIWSSSYCIHHLQGQSYVSASMNDYFNFCRKILGMAMAITGTNSDTLRMERLSFFFDKTTRLLNLDDYGGVNKFNIKPFNDLAGCNLSLGFSKADTNSDFGVDPFITKLFFNTPLTKSNSTIDLEESGAILEQYNIEKIRQQQVTQPIGQNYDPSSPSTDNLNVVFYCLPSPTQFLGPVDVNELYPNINIYNPSNQTVQVGDPSDLQIYQLTQRNGVNLGAAQSTASGTANYIYGLRYPDTAYNIELSPCRILQTDNGSLLHSVLDLMDGQDLIFRNTTVMQYNNTVLGLSGIESNLNGTNLVQEFRDKPISNLPEKLFRPFIFEIEAACPINMYKIMNDNLSVGSGPYGYVSFTWKRQVYKGFIWKTKQRLILNGATTYELIAHPDTTNLQLIQA